MCYDQFDVDSPRLLVAAERTSMDLISLAEMLYMDQELCTQTDLDIVKSVFVMKNAKCNQKDASLK